MKKSKTFLTKEQFYQWKCFVELMDKARLKIEIETLKQKVRQREIDITQLLLKADYSKIEHLGAGYQSALADYEEYKKVLELELGTSLNGKVIDNITFEAKEIKE